MPSKRITRIEFPVKLPAPAQPQPRKRVAAYARVSTMKDAQENSLQSQQDYFAEYIGPVDKSKKSAGTHSGSNRVINWEIAKDGILPSA